jgi:hypothetical protein
MKRGALRGIVSGLVAQDPELGRAMLRLVQAMRDVGGLDQDEAYYLFYWITDQMSFHWSGADAELERISAAMDDIERSHGLSEDESFLVHEAPADWTALSNAWDRRLDTIWAEEFTRLGEAEMARLARAGTLHDDPRIDDGRASLVARSQE